MFDEKNNVTFHISGQLSLQEKISSYGMENFVKVWIRDSRSIGAAQVWRVNSEKKSDITNYHMLAYMVVKKSLSHVEEEQYKPRK